MAEIITQKVPVGISACVYDCPVRYNGKSFDALRIVGREVADFSFTPVCPECFAGLGVPRVPLHLTGTGEEVLAGDAYVRNRRGADLSAVVIEGARTALEIIDRAGVVAFIAKESSPTCGLYKAQVGKRRTQMAGGCGVFGALLLARPDLFVIPETGLANTLAWWDWRRRLHAWLWLRARPSANARDLFESWHVIKFIVQETDRQRADDMGRRLAAMPKRPTAEETDALRGEMLRALRSPSSRAKIRQALWKTYVHHKKKGSLEGLDLHDLSVESPEVRANMTQIVDELTTLERVSFENDLLFGTSPVIARDVRRVKRREDDKAAASAATQGE